MKQRAQNRIVANIRVRMAYLPINSDALQFKKAILARRGKGMGRKKKTEMGVARGDANCVRVLSKLNAMQEVPARQHLPLCGPHEERQMPTVH